MSEWMTFAGTAWRGIKEQIEIAMAISRDAMHMHVGIAMYLLLYLVLRSSGFGIVPLLVVAALAAANEALDLYMIVASDDPVSWGESAKDIVNTLFPPFLIGAFLKFRQGSDRPETDREGIDPPEADPLED